MKLPVLLAALIVAGQLPVHAQEIKPIATNAERFSYGIGLQIGQQLLKQGFSDVDARVIAIAIEDVLEGNELRVTMEEMQVAAIAYQNELKAERLAASDKNKAARGDNGASKTRRAELQVHAEWCKIFNCTQRHFPFYACGIEIKRE